MTKNRQNDWKFPFHILTLSSLSLTIYVKDKTLFYLEMKPCFIFRDKTLFYLKIKAIAFIRDKGHRFYLGKQSSALFRDKGLMIQKELSVGLSAERIGFWRINSQHCYRKFCNGFFLLVFFNWDYCNTQNTFWQSLILYFLLKIIL